MRARLLAALAATALAAVGCGGSSAEEEEPFSLTPGLNAPPIVGGTDAQQRELAVILAGIGPTAIRTVTIEDADGGSVLAFDVGAADSRAGIEAVWHASLIAGSFRDRALLAGLPPVVATSLPGGEESAVGAPDHAPITVTDAPEDEIAAALTDAGLAGPTFTSLRPGDGVAVAVSGRTRDPEAFLAALASAEALVEDVFGDESGFEGVFLEVRDSTGEPFLIVATASRDGSGIVWLRPDLTRFAARLGDLESR